MLHSEKLEEYRKYLQSCADERIEMLAGDLARNEKYKELINEKVSLCRQINNALSEELKTVLVSYDDTENAISGMVQDFYYRQGFQDALMLVKILFCETI